MRTSRHLETFNMRIGLEIKKYLETIAQLEGLSSAEIIRMMILERRNDVRGEMQRLGIYRGELD